MVDERRKPKLPPLKLGLRPMARRDLLEVLWIEDEVQAWAWNMNDFLLCLGAQDCFGIVAIAGTLAQARVVGYVCVQQHRTYLELLNLAVSAKNQGQGVGQRLVGQVLGHLAPPHVNRVICNVRETNVGACKFFRAVGWKATRVKRGYFEDERCDGIEFEYRVASGSPSR